MELYSGDAFLARLDLSPEKSHYVMKTTVMLDQVIHLLEDEQNATYMDFGRLKKRSKLPEN